MRSQLERSITNLKKILIVVIGLLAAGIFIGWRIGTSNNSANTVQPQNNVITDTQYENSDERDIKSLVSYSLPDSWSEARCPGRMHSFYLLPGGVQVDCDTNPSSAVVISIDPANYRDCNELQNVKRVSKHICISEYINGKKSLNAETIFNNESSFKEPTTVKAYYIDIGKAVIKVAYTHDPNSNVYQNEFDTIAKSIQEK